MKRLWVVFAAIAVWIAGMAMVPAAGAQTPVSRPLVGTFDRVSIVLAYYRSPLWAAVVADRQYELGEAKAANDTARVAELEKWGEERQRLAMEQMAGKAPIDNILAALKQQFRQLSAQLKLTDIVDANSADPKANRTDVTAVLLERLGASAETRQMAADMRVQSSASK